MLSATASLSQADCSAGNGVGARGPAAAVEYGAELAGGGGGGCATECLGGGTQMLETCAFTPSVNTLHAGPNGGGPASACCAALAAASSCR